MAKRSAYEPDLNMLAVNLFHIIFGSFPYDEQVTAQPPLGLARIRCMRVKVPPPCEPAVFRRKPGLGYLTSRCLRGGT